MFKRFIWLIMLIPLQATGQDTDHPATSLARMQEAFLEASKPDYKQMISLMDSMITMNGHQITKSVHACSKHIQIMPCSLEKAWKGRLYITCTCTPGFPKSRILTA